jgi:hypothetical protein
LRPKASKLLNQRDDADQPPVLVVEDTPDKPLSRLVPGI